MEVLAVVSTVATLASAVTGYSAARQEGASQAAAARYNAEQAQEQAAITQTQTAADVERQRRENLVRTGQAVAASGAGGGLSGSALDVIASNIQQQELDILNIQQQGKLKERSLLQQAGLDLATAKTAKRTSSVKAAGALLGGTAQAAGRAAPLF